MDTILSILCILLLTEFTDLCWRAHEGGFGIPDDWETLRRRHLAYLTPAERRSFDTALQLHARKRTVQHHDMKKLIEGVARGAAQVPAGADAVNRGVEVRAWNSSAGARDFSDEHAGGLRQREWFGVGAPLERSAGDA